MRGIQFPESLPLGSPLPPGDVHAVGVHLPMWQDTVGWASRDHRVVDAMKTGYPRFFVPRVVDVLEDKIIRIFHSDEQSPRSAILFPCRRYARLYINFLLEQAPRVSQDDIRECAMAWHGSMTILNNYYNSYQLIPNTVSDPSPYKREISAVIYPTALYPITKAFWQHTGFGLSSRQATFWLDNMTHWGNQGWAETYDPTDARQAIRRRISAGQSTAEVDVGDDAVFLYPTGMTALTEAALAIKTIRSRLRSRGGAAVYGFTYVDTYKTLTRVLNYGTTLYKYTEIHKLEQELEAGLHLDALFTEFPGNPLLQTPDLTRLHDLSRKYNFILVVDDTVGTYINVNLVYSCDVICTSLTKMFSGGCNVMGGAVVIPPLSPHQQHLQSALQKVNDDDIWFPLDVRVMEENSRDFRERVLCANKNAELVVQLLRDPQHKGIVEEVYYPKGSPTQEIYDRFRIHGEEGQEGGYGFLLSIKFTSPARAIAFYDAFDVAKGPSLGTNFTLCCAYTLLAHYSELEWAAEYGVVEHLVRISVGLEDEEWLRGRVDKALKAAGEVRD